MAKQGRDGLYKRGRIWWVRKDPIEGKALSTGCTDLEAAQRWRALRERDAADPSHAASNAALLGEWVTRFLAWKALKKSSHTVSFYEQKLGHWTRRLGDDAKLSELSHPAAFDYHAEQRRDEGASDRTIHKECAAMLSLLRMAKRKGVFPADLITLMPTDLDAGYKPRQRALNRGEVIRLLTALPPHRAALVALCVGLGCRLSEVYRLTPHDVQADRVFIGGTKTAGSVRYVPILSLYRPLIEQAKPYLPLLYWGNLHRDLARACEVAGIERVTPNDLRRSHATIARNAGLDIDTARRLLGHTSSALLQRTYDQPTVEELSERAEKTLSTVDPIQLRDSGIENVVGRQGFEPWTNGLKIRSIPSHESIVYNDSVELSSLSAGEEIPTNTLSATRTLQTLALANNSHAGPSNAPAVGQEAGNFSEHLAAAWALRTAVACLEVCRV